METSDFIDNIKAEKANALARYKLFTNITKLIQLMEVFVAVAVISWSSTYLPSAFKFSGEFFLTFSYCFTNQHVVFLLGNAIVVACYVLSRHTDSGNDSSSSDYDKYNQLSNLCGSNAKTTPSQVIRINETSRETDSRIPIIRFQNQNEKSATAIKQMERFQRTNSDKLKNRIPVKSGRELRRSVTEMRRSTAVGCGGEERLKAVEELSNEEFRIAVERFILKQQRLLKEQSMSMVDF